MKKAVIFLSGCAVLAGAGCTPSLGPLTENDAYKAALSVIQGHPPTFVMATAVSSTEPDLSIHITIPTVTEGLASFEARSTFNEEMANTAFELVNDFRTEYGDVAPQERGSAPWELLVDAEVPTSTKRLQSVILNGYQYTGGAHGLTFSVAKIFDTKEQRWVQLTDLFEPQTNIPAQLSEFTRQELLTRETVKDDPEWVTTGTEPSDENYSTVYATDQGLTVIFSDYQIGPHALAPQRVTVPWNKLQTLKKEYRPL